jgi:hypothetical protein
LKKNENGISTYLLSQGNALLEEINPSGMPVYFYNPGLSIDDGTSTGYYFYDGMGSTTLQMDPVKAIMATTDFDEFGIVTNSTGMYLNDRVLFGNMVYVPAIDLFSSIGYYDFTTGYYDQITGQLMTDDGLQFESEDSDPGARSEPPPVDPDFDLLRITGGLGNGLPNPPQSEPGGNNQEENGKKEEKKKEENCPVGKAYAAPVTKTSEQIIVDEHGTPNNKEAEANAKANHKTKAEASCMTIGAKVCTGPCPGCGDKCEGKLVGVETKTHHRQEAGLAYEVIEANKAACNCFCEKKVALPK